jgi:hypothetical protein
MKKGKRRIHHRAANKIRRLLAKKKPGPAETYQASDAITAYEGEESPFASLVEPPLQEHGSDSGKSTDAKEQNNYQRDFYERQQLQLTRRLIGATIVTAAATVIYMAFTGYQAYKFRESVAVARQQADAANHSAEVAQHTFELLERPSLGINFIGEPELIVGKRAQVKMEIKNFGHVPAPNVTVMAASLFLAPMIDITGPCPEPGPITEVLGLPSRSLIAVGGVRTVVPTSKVSAVPSDLIAINEQKSHWLYMWLQVRYGNSERYFLEYYARRNVGEKAWEECDKHNNAN